MSQQKNLVLVQKTRFYYSGSSVFTAGVSGVNWTSEPSGQSAERAERTSGRCRALLRSERHIVKRAQKAVVRHDKEPCGGRAG